MDYLPHQQRVVEEAESLNEKLEKLGEFIATNPIFGKLSLMEQARMKTQMFHMRAYLVVLHDRIAAF